MSLKTSRAGNKHLSSLLYCFSNGPVFNVRNSRRKLSSFISIYYRGIKTTIWYAAGFFCALLVCFAQLLMSLRILHEKCFFTYKFSVILRMLKSITDLLTQLSWPTEHLFKMVVVVLESMSGLAECCCFSFICMFRQHSLWQIFTCNLSIKLLDRIEKL